jgi:hypothetical protein
MGVVSQSSVLAQVGWKAYESGRGGFGGAALQPSPEATITKSARRPSDEEEGFTPRNERPIAPDL